jgi:hypothetical protein
VGFFAPVPSDARKPPPDIDTRSAYFARQYLTSQEANLNRGNFARFHHHSRRFVAMLQQWKFFLPKKLTVYRSFSYKKSLFSSG